MNLRLLNCQPATDYYAWQVEVNLDNLISMGYSDNSIDIVAGYTDRIPDSWMALAKRFSNVRFHFYRDSRQDTSYPPSIQAHLLAKHWKRHPYLSKEAVFFHDCDFIFTKKFNFHEYLNDDIWYFSDCTSYLGCDYIESKSHVLLELMCETIDICSCKVKGKSAGGAQKLIKNVHAEYWESVERDSVNLYKMLSSERVKKMKKDDDPNPIQAWTASMWAELWNAWKRGIKVETPVEFNFAWATDPIDKWDLVSFFHNAGVADANNKMFYKADYTMSLPYDEELDLDLSRCSHKYFDIVKKTGRNTCLR
jgi:hypothetical protein